MNIINNDFECNRNCDNIDNNDIDNRSRESNYREPLSENNGENNDTDENDLQRMDHFNINIYRYKFTNEFTHELFKFSKIHQYDERKAFKEAWTIWMEDNDDIVNEEYRRLKELGYQGDIFDKMFKSARYYFRKKSTEKKEPSKRRIYVGTQKDLIEAMDEHIKSNIISGEFKPSEGFDEFCKQNISVIKEEIAKLFCAGYKDENEIEAKIKKTYKNRYFLFIKK